MTFITDNKQFIVYDIINALKIIQYGIEKIDNGGGRKWLIKK
jgi:hypothetical protein